MLGQRTHIFQGNLSNVACADLGLILLDDASRWTVARAEVRSGAAVVAAARAFHKEMLAEVSASSSGLCVHYLTQDATNSAIWQKRKLTALILHTAYLPSLPDSTGSSNFVFSWKSFQALQRVADVQPVGDATAASVVGLCHKMLQSVGCPSPYSLVADFASGAKKKLVEITSAAVLFSVCGVRVRY